jgi:hypothetical protein
LVCGVHSGAIEPEDERGGAGHERQPDPPNSAELTPAWAWEAECRIQGQASLKEG